MSKSEKTCALEAAATALITAGNSALRGHARRTAELAAARTREAAVAVRAALEQAE